MKDLIKIENTTIGDASVPTVNARELHEFLESKQEFANWIKKRIEKYKFIKKSWSSKYRVFYNFRYG